MGRYVCVLLMILWGSSEALRAQNEDFEKYEHEKPTEPLFVKSEGVFRVQLNSDGFTLGGYKGFVRGAQTHVLEGSLSVLHNLRAHRQQFEYTPVLGQDAPRYFVFGKQNHFYSAKVGYQQKRTLTKPVEEKAIQIGLSYGGGISLGLLRPYYLKIIEHDHSSTGEDVYRIIELKYSDDTNNHFLNLSHIYGGAEPFKGFDELTPLPGGYLRGSVFFDWGKNIRNLRLIEAGLEAELYSKAVPLMINEENKPYFYRVFVAVSFGKRK